MKKAQFYIFTAIILCAFAMILLAKGASIRVPEESFTKLDQNFRAEEAKVINSGIRNGILATQWEEFAGKFINYSKTRNPNFGLVYLLNTENELRVGNFINSEINVSIALQNVTLNPSTTKVINQSSIITVSFDNNKYDFNISINIIQSKLLFWTKQGRNIRVYQKK